MKNFNPSEQVRYAVRRAEQKAEFTRLMNIGKVPINGVMHPAWCKLWHVEGAECNCGAAQRRSEERNG